MTSGNILETLSIDLYNIVFPGLITHPDLFGQFQAQACQK